MSLLDTIKQAWAKRLICTADRHLQSLAGFHQRGYTHDDVIGKCRQAIRLTPDFPNAYLVLGNGLYGKNSYEEAVVQYKKALDLDPDLYFAQLHLAEVLHLLADQAAEKANEAQAMQLYDEALAGYRKAFSLQEEDRQGHTARICQVLRAQGRYDDIIRECDILQEMDIESTDLLRESLGNALLETGQYARAQSVYEQLLKERAGEKRYLCGLAASLQGQGLTDEALAAFRQAEENVAAGKLLLENGREEEALKEFKLSIHRDEYSSTDGKGKPYPKDEMYFQDLAFYHAGILLYNRGEDASAVPYLEKFLALLDRKEPTFFTAVQGRRQEYDQYIAQTKRVVNELGKNPR